MKLMPCRGRCPGASATLPDGKPYVIGSFPEGRHPLRYRCSTCGHSTAIQLLEYNALPELTLADLRALGVASHVTRDLEGAGVTPEQIEELEVAGIEWASLHPTRAERNTPGDLTRGTK